MWYTQRFPRISFLQSCDYAGKELSIQQEVDEALKVLQKKPSGYGFEEIIINFDRKFTPYHQILEISKKLLKKDIKVGQDVFITPWIPSSYNEGPFRQLATLLSIMDTNAKLFKDIKKLAISNLLISMIHSEKLFLDARRRIFEILQISNEEFGIENRQEEFLLIPVFQDIQDVFNATHIMENLIMGSEREGIYLNKMRIAFNLAEIAIKSSFVPAYLATKIALKNVKAFQEDSDYHFSIMLMGGSLPYRGNLSSDNMDYLKQSLPNVETYIMPATFIYNNTADKAAETISLILDSEPSEEVEYFELDEVIEMKKISLIFEYHYRKDLYDAFKDTLKLSEYVPTLRSRYLHLKERTYPVTGRYKEYSNIFSEDYLQNYIKEIQALDEYDIRINSTVFATTMYTIGLPPEILGAGKAFRCLRKYMGEEGLSKLLKEYFPGIISYYNKILEFSHPEISRDLVSEKLITEFEQSLDELSKLPGIKMISNDTYGSYLKESIVQLKKASLGKKFNKNQLFNIFIELGKMRGALA